MLIEEVEYVDDGVLNHDIYDDVLMDKLLNWTKNKINDIELLKCRRYII